MSDYLEFIRNREQAPPEEGFAPVFVHDGLRDFQSHLVEWATRCARTAILADCGLGKTPIQLVWAENVVRKMNGRVLVLAPLAVAAQTIREGEKFGVECQRSRDGRVNGSGIYVTNYEKLDKFDPSDFVAVVCDESSILKSFDGVRRQQITSFMRKMPFRLLCTATAAPNDYDELGTSSEALGHLGYMDMLSRFFVADDGRGSAARRGWGKEVKFRLKGHAELPFWRWVCSWAMAVRRPSDLGYDDGEFVLPPLVENIHVVGVSNLPRGFLFEPTARNMREERDATRRSIEERCEKAAELASDGTCLLWCNLNDEGNLLAGSIPGAVQVSGSDADEAKEERLLGFANGEIRVLVTKPKIGAFGLNFQRCAHVVTFPTHCYDQETEVLTRRGWSGFGELTYDDQVATVDDRQFFEWQSPTDLIWSPYKGQMVYFGNDRGCQSFDLLVTPNHRMYVRECPLRYRDAEGWHFRTAAEVASGFKRQKLRMLSVPAGFVGSDMESVRIPDLSVVPRTSSKAVNASGNLRGMSTSSWSMGLDRGHRNVFGSIPISNFVQFVGWYLSEGDLGARGGILDGQIRISQCRFINPDNHAEIVGLMRGMGFRTVSISDKGVGSTSIQLANFIDAEFGNGSANKRIPEWVKNLAVPHLVLLRDTMMKGDGHRSGAWYCTISKRLADDFAEICIKTGVRASVQWRESIWRVNLARHNLSPTIWRKPELVDYAGMVGCVTVPNGTVIVRRGGIPIVSGNSYERHYQGVRRCWRFGQTQQVTVDVIGTDGLEWVMENLRRKAQQAEEMFDRLVATTREARGLSVERTLSKMETPKWIR